LSSSCDHQSSPVYTTGIIGSGVRLSRLSHELPCFAGWPALSPHGSSGLCLCAPFSPSDNGVQPSPLRRLAASAQRLFRHSLRRSSAKLGSAAKGARIYLRRATPDTDRSSGQSASGTETNEPIRAFFAIICGYGSVARKLVSSAGTRIRGLQSSCRGPWLRTRVSSNLAAGEHRDAGSRIDHSRDHLHCCTWKPASNQQDQVRLQISGKYLRLLP
jgi:hypothetical protein